MSLDLKVYFKKFAAAFFDSLLLKNYIYKIIYRFHLKVWILFEIIIGYINYFIYLFIVLVYILIKF
jgi:hypothetical protein